MGRPAGIVTDGHDSVRDIGKAPADAKEKSMYSCLHRRVGFDEIKKESLPRKVRRNHIDLFINERNFIGRRGDSSLANETNRRECRILSTNAEYSADFQVRLDTEESCPYNFPDLSDFRIAEKGMANGHRYPP